MVRKRSEVTLNVWSIQTVRFASVPERRVYYRQSDRISSSWAKLAMPGSSP